MGIPFRSVNDVVATLHHNKPENYVVFVVEFDELSRFNHLISHDIDEHIFSKLCERISNIFGKETLVERIGTYRCVIMYSDKPQRIRNQALSYAERIIGFLKEPLHFQSHLFYVTAAIGLSLGGKHDNPYIVLKNAERALRQAQTEGKNHIKFYKEPPLAPLNREMHLLKILPHSIDNGEFYFLYQPQFDPQMQRFVGAEVLMRWYHPEIGDISPIEFIPLAEKSGMIIPLTLHLLVDVSDIFRKLKAINQNNFSIAVNIAPDMMLERGFIDNISLLLTAYDLKGKPLTFEIMESILARDIDTFKSMLLQLKQLGIKLALDDYGTGHTSYNYLMQLPIDTLKIDRSFVAFCDNDSKRYAILKSMFNLADALGFHIVAEGVERKEEAKTLSELGACIMQGYHFAKPMRKEALLELLTS
jgi:diguanylate cyclase (GGDEF)-like protein